MRGEHANHYTTDAVVNVRITKKQWLEIQTKTKEFMFRQQMIGVRLGSSERLAPSATTMALIVYCSNVIKIVYTWNTIQSVIGDWVIFIPVTIIPKTRNEDNVMLAPNILTLSIRVLIPMINIIPNTWKEKHVIFTNIIIWNPNSSKGVKHCTYETTVGIHMYLIRILFIYIHVL